MTIDKKREIISSRCIKCDTCPLKIDGWKKPFAGTLDCLDIAESDEDDLDRALKILGIKEIDIVNSEDKNTMSETDAIEYIEYVLRAWPAWKTHHKTLVKALEVILARLKKERK